VRQRTGASVIAIIRDQHVLANPKSGTQFQVGDLVGLLGDSTQIAAFDQLLTAPENAARPAEPQEGAAPASSRVPSAP
jgi:CPA2 family monovalent cation:H+ antiporter-2